MKTSSLRIQDPFDVSSRPRRHRIFAGFTLVEMLVVITIIGILAALVIPAAYSVMVAAKRARIAMEIKQLEMACQAYKEKFGEYPPDFSRVNDFAHATMQDAARAAVVRHLSKAFPRFVIPGSDITAQWASLQSTILTGWNIDITLDTCSPASALVFWLGGQPLWTGGNNPPTDRTKPVTGFGGFAADPTNPFQSMATCPSRIGPFYDFSTTSVGQLAATSPALANTPVSYWPRDAYGDKTQGCIVYFRAENGNYTTDAATLAADMSNAKYATVTVNVWPAVDAPVSTISASGGPYVFVNPSSIQIFSAGLNVRYSVPGADSTFYPGVTGNVGPYEFPTGRNYQPDTYGNITNFSNGTLEASMK